MTHVLAVTVSAVLESQLQVEREQLEESFACTNDVPVKAVNDMMLIHNTGAHFHHCILRPEETLTTTNSCVKPLIPGTRMHCERFVEPASG